MSTGRAEEGRADSKRAEDLPWHRTCTLRMPMRPCAEANPHATEKKDQAGCRKSKSPRTCEFAVFGSRGARGSGSHGASIWRSLPIALQTPLHSPEDQRHARGLIWGLSGRVEITAGLKYLTPRGQVALS